MQPCLVLPCTSSWRYQLQPQTLTTLVSYINTELLTTVTATNVQVSVMSSDGGLPEPGGCNTVRVWWWPCPDYHFLCWVEEDCRPRCFPHQCPLSGLHLDAHVPLDVCQACNACTKFYPVQFYHWSSQKTALNVHKVKSGIKGKAFWEISLCLRGPKSYPILSVSISKKTERETVTLSSPVSSSSKSDVLRKSKLSSALSTVRLKLDERLRWAGHRHWAEQKIVNRVISPGD